MGSNKEVFTGERESKGPHELRKSPSWHVKMSEALDKVLKFDQEGKLNVKLTRDQQGKIREYAEAVKGAKGYEYLQKNSSNFLKPNGLLDLALALLNAETSKRSPLDPSRDSLILTVRVDRKAVEKDTADELVQSHQEARTVPLGYEAIYGQIVALNSGDKHASELLKKSKITLKEHNNTSPLYPKMRQKIQALAEDLKKPTWDGKEGWNGIDPTAVLIGEVKSDTKSGLKPQRLYLLFPDKIIEFTVSIARRGIGYEVNQSQTPPGRFILSGITEKNLKKVGQIVGPYKDGVMADLKSRGITSVSSLKQNNRGALMVTMRIPFKGIDQENHQDKYSGVNLHGSNVEGLLGDVASHGCVRMSNADISFLPFLVRQGSMFVNVIKEV